MSLPFGSDADIQRAVREELDLTPDVDAPGIGVAVEDGTVTLLGEVDSDLERLAARDAALRVPGIRTVVNSLTIADRTLATVSETEIAREVERALRSSHRIPSAVKAIVTSHDVMLVGEVDEVIDRDAAFDVIRHLRGVRHVTSAITVRHIPAIPENRTILDIG